MRVSAFDLGGELVDRIVNRPYLGGFGGFVRSYSGRICSRWRRWSRVSRFRLLWGSAPFQEGIDGVSDRPVRRRGGEKGGRRGESNLRVMAVPRGSLRIAVIV